MQIAVGGVVIVGVLLVIESAHLGADPAEFQGPLQRLPAISEVQLEIL